MRAKVLVVDDEESIRFTFNAFLSKEGHHVFTANDYTSAMKIISNEDIDLIFADVILGDFTGIEILGEVRERGLQCPVIMITGKPSINTAAEAVQNRRRQPDSRMLAHGKSPVCPPART